MNAGARHSGNEQILPRPAFADASGDSSPDTGEVEVVEGGVDVEDAAREGFTHRVFRRGIVCGQPRKERGGGEWWGLVGGGGVWSGGEYGDE